MPLFSTAAGTTSLVVLLLAVFGASAVEMVEALTLVVAAGTRSWSSALRGAVAAVVLLGVLVGIGGVPLVEYTPIDALRVAVGTMLLLLGFGWLRKAVLRSAGLIAIHDENAIYARTVADLARGERPGKEGRDPEAFSVAFKGVFLEGVEVVLIVISLGASQHRLAAAAGAAAAAVVVVAVVGALVARQLSEVPENAMKMVVGVMLLSFGTFWVGQGAGVHWPASDASLPVLVAAYAALTALLIAWMRRGVAVAPGRDLVEEQV